jgi:hypothetical protein
MTRGRRGMISSAPSAFLLLHDLPAPPGADAQGARVRAGGLRVVVAAVSTARCEAGRRWPHPRGFSSQSTLTICQRPSTRAMCM